MKVVLTGNRNPHFFNTVQCRVKALRELGHQVVFFDNRAHIIPGRLRRRFAALQSLDKEWLSWRLRQMCRQVRPDLLIAIGGDFSFRTMEEISSSGIPAVLWTTDPPVDPAVISEPAAAYDHVFCSGTEALAIARQGNCRREPLWLPFACDPELHAPTRPDSIRETERYSRQAAFVGAYYPNRAQVFEVLAQYKSGIWGPSWDKLREESPLRPFVETRRLRHDEWRKIYTLSDCVLVAHYQDGHTPCYQASPKLFEALACGAFVLCDRQKDAQTLFGDGRHLVFFSSPQELRDKLVYYLARPEDRRRIAAAGRAEVLARHTYRHRCAELLRLVAGGGQRHV